MNRVAFQIFGIDIMWYGVIISIGMIVAFLLANRLAKNEKLSEDIMVDWFLWTVPIGVIGARLYYVIFNWENYKGDIFKIINIRGGGLAIHGGIIAGLIVTYVFCKIKKISFTKFIDIIAPALVLAQGIGRWGNFTNQEAHGTPTDLPWAIMVDGVNVHPTFLYESIADIGICIFLLWYFKRKKYDGQIFLIYLLLYSIIRFFIEGLRTDSLYFMGLRTAQVVSVIGILISVVLLFYNWKKINKMEEKM